MLRFPNFDALHMALTSGLVPPSVSLAPAHYRRDPDGAIGIAPNSGVPAGLADALRAFGIDVVASPLDGQPIDHWLEALPLQRMAKPPRLTNQTPVLFEGSEATVADLAREMLRLGNDRQSFRLVQTTSTRFVLLHVLGPPYFSLLQAMDRQSADGPRAYLESSPNVWIEIGWAHPLAGQVRPADRQMLLLQPPNHWRTIDALPFHDIYEVLSLDTEPPSANWTDAPWQPIDVPLRLSPGNSIEAPELWLLNESGEAVIDDLVRESDRLTLDRLSFAVAQTESGPLAVLRARPHPLGPPTLVLPGATPFRPFLRVPNLFVPCGATVNPPLSREWVRRLLADDPDRVTWLVPLPDNDFAPMSLPETAFRPLREWVEYILTRDRKKLADWAASSACDFAVWTSRDPPREPPETRRTSARRTADAPQSAAPTAPPNASARLPRRPRRPRTPVEPPSAASAMPVNELQVQLRALEDRFIEAEGNLETPERQALWPRLGRLNAAVGQTAEAAHCWLHALWEDPPSAPDLAWAWVETESALVERGISDADLARLMPPTPANTADLRPLAAALVWGCRQRPIPPVLRQRLPAIQDYLSRVDALLPVRAVWLVWHTLISAVGGDALALARIRDRLLDRLLSSGLNPERDLPAFLRYSDSQGGDRLRTVRDRLENLRLAIHRWSGFSPGDTLQQTSSYIDLMFAFANARLGEAGAAQALLGSAAERLDASGNGAHRFLLEAFRWRIEQVLAGKPHAGPLPPEQIEYLDQMRQEVDKLQRELQNPHPELTLSPYVVERMRKESRIVDPHEELDPYWKTKSPSDPVIRELARLFYMRDPRTLRDGLRRFLSSTQTHSQSEVRLRVLAEAIPLAARLGAAACGELLDRVGPLLAACPSTSDPIVQSRRALLIERALLFAIHFDRTDLVAGLFFELESAITEPASSTVRVARSRMIAESFRGLRKCGLRDESERLLQRLAEQVQFDPHAPIAALDRANMEQAVTMLHVASGWLSANHLDRARPILDRAREMILGGRDVPQNEWPLYLSLVSGYIAAAARAPMEETLRRIEELFTSGKMPKLPNTLTTQPYYSWLHLSLVETVVLALANEEFAMGPAARRWLDDDEYLVRRRIHRDLRAAMHDDRTEIRE